MDDNEYVNIRLRCNAILYDLEKVIKDIKDDNLQNDQGLISWIDQVNKLSVEF